MRENWVGKRQNYNFEEDFQNKSIDKKKHLKLKLLRDLLGMTYLVNIRNCDATRHFYYYF